eukprot:TRINITY_DN1685_c0_g1_i1.p1 TRINITY_DN1685_c0_g1~~TRINITY_DN1685_c0_g1_i1.p1  ORF type:complete len:1027 (+),score=415.86 TRINITY_DN1685_c0_g1_i1:160-3240(+)
MSTFNLHGSESTPKLLGERPPLIRRNSIQGKFSYFKDKDGVKVTLSDAKTEFPEQMATVVALIKAEQLLNDSRVEQEVAWYYGNLGLSKNYFEIHSPEEISKHIISLYNSKVLSQTNKAPLNLSMTSTRKGNAFFFSHSMPGRSDSPCQAIERMIEEQFLGDRVALPRKQVPSNDINEEDELWRLHCFRTRGTVAPSSDIHLRFYMLTETKFKSKNVSENETDLSLISDIDWLATSSQTTQKWYSDIIKEAVNTNGPVIKVVDTASDDTKHLLIAYRSRSTRSFLTGVTNLYHTFGLYSSRKHVEHFSNGLTVMDIQLFAPKPESYLNAASIQKLVEEANLVYVLPMTSMSPMFTDGTLSIREYAYAYAAWKFVFQFLSRQSSEFTSLGSALKDNPDAYRILGTIKTFMKKEAITEGRVLDTLFQYPALLKELYKDFEFRHHKSGQEGLDEQTIMSRINRAVPSEFDRQIFQAFHTFNRHILKTNFFLPSKVALSFRLSPGFLSKTDYPITPFAIFFVVGTEFRGFHIRFRDVARGGIRIIRSANLQSYIQNVTSLFDENYNLANTQERKNKDIAEGGSKGTILLSLDGQDRALAAFKKYVDGLLDLLLPNSSMIDLYGKEELLFLGPDEGTANYMDWASTHARERKYKFWKAFTTGKSRSVGGIPHDLYGMTTRSIHQYVLGAMEKMGLDESKVTKFQTGGPDGDLGSNEIKISKDLTTAIVDGSGVLFDPKGINRSALGALAEARKMVRDFDKSKLSPEGFFVDVDGQDISLPDGTVIQSGLEYRNQFHLNPLSSSYFFVPCGGRPEAINLSNVHTAILADGSNKWKVVVEGANLFFSQEARLFLEKRGVIIFKDASANKGGVTSSSLEVLAALSLNDQEFEQHMSVKTSEPEFYASYIKEVHRIIEENSRLEFGCLWNEHKRSGTAISILSDSVSNKINELSLSLSSSELWNNDHLRKKVLTAAIPKNLLELVGIEALLERVPENYMRAIFGTYLASRYVYSCGLAANPEFSFFNFITTQMSK